MKATSIMAAILTLAGAAGWAHVPGTTVTTLFQDDPDVRAFTGATDSDPNCLQVLSDGRVAFFESESTAGNNAQDAVVLFDPAQSGTARFTVIASEAALGAIAGAASPDIFAEDMTIDDNDNIYLLAAQAASGGDNYFIAKIPYSGSGYGVPELIAGSGVAPSGIPPTEGHGALDYDSQNNRLILYVAEDVAETDLTGIAGLYTLPVTSGSLTPVQTLVGRDTMVSVLTPTPGTDTGDRGTFDDIAVLPNGDIVAVFNVRQGTQLNGDNDGDIILVTSGGTPFPFIDATLLSADVVADYGKTTMYLDYNSGNGTIGMIEEFTTVTARNLIVEYSTGGEFVRKVADVEDLLQNTGSANLQVYSRAFDTDSAGNYIVFTGYDNESCQKIEHGDVVLYAQNWLLY